MASDIEIIREYHEADFAYRTAFAKAGADDTLVALPGDVREARASLQVEAEAKRFLEAKIAVEAMRSEREDRWIAAHEDLAILRNVGRTPLS